MFEAFPLTLNPWLPIGVLWSTFLLIPDHSCRQRLTACAESCSDRIIGMDTVLVRSEYYRLLEFAAASRIVTILLTSQKS
jgi:hypothetical protein